MMAQVPAEGYSSSLFFQKGEGLITKVRKGHLLQTESQTCHQQMPKLHLAQPEIKFCPLRKPRGIESCVVLCCPCVIHAGIIPPCLSGERQRAAVMPRAATAPTKALGARGAGLLPGSAMREGAKHRSFHPSAPTQPVQEKGCSAGGD